MPYTHNSSHSTLPTQKRVDGFTIVELLIVVVVIAILAAITIVSYNGIQNRARASAAQSTAKQAFTKIETFAFQNGETYPASLNAAGLNQQPEYTYQYYVNNMVSPKHFCVSVTSGTISYFVTKTQTSPQTGTCYAQNIISTSFSSWESGDYAQADGTLTSNTNRVRHIGLVAVEPGASYTMSTGTSPYSLVIRGFRTDGTFYSNVGAYATGSTLNVPSSVAYIGVSLYQPNGSPTYETYAGGFGNGSVVPSIIRVQ